MKRRTYLISVGAGATALAGCIAVAEPEDTPQAGYQGEQEVVYEREPLQLLTRTDEVHVGDSITFEVRHTGDSENISLGCNIPWAIQKYEDGKWKHAVWTDQRWHQMCATLIAPGDTLTTTVPLSATELADEQGISEAEADVTFTPGKCRFILVGSNPSLAVNFRVLPVE